MSCKCKEQLCRGWPQEANHKLHDLHRWIQKLGQPHKNVAPEYIHIAHESCLPWNSQQISSKEEEKKILKELLLSTIFGYFGLYPCDSLSYLPLCFVRATSTGSARKIRATWEVWHWDHQKTSPNCSLASVIPRDCRIVCRWLSNMALYSLWYLRNWVTSGSRLSLKT